MAERTDELTSGTHHGCPVIHIDYRQSRSALETYESLNTVREIAPILWNETEPTAYWMVTRYDQVREALQRSDVFTNDVVSALGDPDNHIRLLPQNLNPPEHVWYRHVVNPWFSPGTLRRIEGYARQRCIELLEDLKATGGCDLTVEFAMQYPTEIFFALLGLPPEDGFALVPAVEGVFRGFFGGPPDEMARDVKAIRSYFKGVVDRRIDEPGDTDTDFVSYLLQSEVNGTPIDPDDVLTLCLTILLAGMDTTRSAMGYILYHLATHPEDRRVLVEDPSKIPAAIEEFIRLYSLVYQDGRFVAQDVEFHGCPMKRGDIVWLGLAQANRDPRQFDRPDEFVIDRESNKHLGFAAGAHRCLGAHLARLELVVVLEEWLRLIPDFRLATEEPLTERGGQLMLRAVPLTWEA